MCADFGFSYYVIRLKDLRKPFASVQGALVCQIFESLIIYQLQH